jgi:undecaprenyl-diphosphatase
LSPFSFLALGAVTALILLGAIQGATEFLPVSSSGHLVIFGHWFGLDTEQGLSREIALHFGTLVAVVLFCFADLKRMLGAGSAGLWKLVIGASVVTAAVGMPLKDTIAEDLNTPFAAGCFLLGTTFLLVVVAPRNDEKQTRVIDDATWTHALIMGLFQSLALAPGVSRAGSTIVGALLLGYRRHDAVRIAFLISIPAVGGAVLLDAVRGDTAELAVQPDMIAAMAVACVVGTLALRFIAVRVDAASLRMFGYYTAAMGVAAILTA